MLEDLSQKNWKEVEAERYDLNYISLDGNIGCMVNGAGLAMATMDLISTKNGTPANFLDVGGRATDEQVVAALKIMDNDPNVESILVNIFAGIARADVIALGLIKGIMETGMKKPIVLRMKGTNIEEAKQIISDSGFNLFLTEDLE
jgi:succinyl-CoA synthetase beta subunit